MRYAGIPLSALLYRLEPEIFSFFSSHQQLQIILSRAEVLRFERMNGYKLRIQFDEHNSCGNSSLLMQRRSSSKMLDGLTF